MAASAERVAASTVLPLPLPLSTMTTTTTPMDDARVVLVRGRHLDVVSIATGAVVASTRPDAGAVVAAVGGAPARPILSACVSRDGALLAAAADDKAVTVWSTLTWAVVASGTAHKRVSSLAFTHSSTHLVAADKFGDVFSFSVADRTMTPQLLMGHLSLVTDVITSPDDALILTADRDEKIRVSRLPQAFVIEGFCLGHLQFVTCLHFPPTIAPSRLLVSGGGDGLVILWDYVACTALQTVDLTRLRPTAADAASDDDSAELDVMRIASAMQGSGTTLVAVAAERHPQIYLFRLAATPGGAAALELLGVHATDALGHPTDIAFDSHGRLWVTTDRTAARLVTCLAPLAETLSAPAKALDGPCAPEVLLQEEPELQARMDAGVNAIGSLLESPDDRDAAPLFKYGELRKLVRRPGGGSGAGEDDGEDDEGAADGGRAAGLDAPDDAQAAAAAKRSRERRDRVAEARKRAKKPPTPAA